MKKLGIAMLAVGALAASVPVYAMDMGNAVRFGAGMGRYGGFTRIDLVDVDPPANSQVFEVTSVGFAYGGELGYTFSMSDFYIDTGLNILGIRFGDAEDYTRTDVLVTLGYYITDNWSVFAGFRRGWQGEKAFNDDFFKEIGPYLGVGYGGIPLGGWGTMNTSFAYNFDKAKDFPQKGADFDYPGFSLKLGVNLKNTPHSVQLRLQRFSGDDSLAVPQQNPVVPTDYDRVDFELEETWAVLSYVYTLAW